MNLLVAYPTEHKVFGSSSIHIILSICAFLSVSHHSNHNIFREENTHSDEQAIIYAARLPERQLNGNMLAEEAIVPP